MALMTNNNIRLFPHDKLMRHVVIPLVPQWVHPNHITVFRFFLIPFVLLGIWYMYWEWAFWLFLFAAFTDALDGSVARLRKKITMWGTMADPIADKLLVGTVVIVFVAREINVWFSILIVFFELMILAGSYYRKRKGIYSSANNAGKIKMLLQVLGVCILLLARVFGIPLAVPFAIGTFSLALVFAMISLVTYSL
jgi:CDP-diacylglycerol--glycerol-3-phosphate 3-phosphatidyltransferase